MLLIDLEGCDAEGMSLILDRLAYTPYGEGRFDIFIKFILFAQLSQKIST